MLRFRRRQINLIDTKVDRNVSVDFERLAEELLERQRYEARVESLRREFEGMLDEKLVVRRHEHS